MARRGTLPPLLLVAATLILAFARDAPKAQSGQAGAQPFDPFVPNHLGTVSLGKDLDMMSKYTQGLTDPAPPPSKDRLEALKAVRDEARRRMRLGGKPKPDKNLEPSTDFQAAARYRIDRSPMNNQDLWDRARVGWDPIAYAGVSSRLAAGVTAEAKQPNPADDVVVQTAKREKMGEGLVKKSSGAGEDQQHSWHAASEKLVPRLGIPECQGFPFCVQQPMPFPMASLPAPKGEISLPSNAEIVAAMQEREQ